MFNKIKSFVHNCREKVTEKATKAYCKVQSAAKAEFYIDKTVGIIIAVVVGALLLGIVYTFIRTNVQTQLNSKITEMWSYTN